MMSKQQEKIIRILLIEDNPGDAKLINLMLASDTINRYEIHWVTRLSEGLQAIHENNLDGILLDLTLPDSSGLQTVSKVKKACHSVPIIILTGINDDDTALEALQAGAQDYLCKDEITERSLRRAIQYAITRKSLEDRINLQATAMQAAANIVFITDDEGIIEWVNPAFTQVTGYSPDEVIGKKPNILKSGQHPKEFYAAMWNAITAGETWYSEVINRRKDGRHFIVEQTVTPFSGYNGEITNFVAIQQDITLRREAEEAEQHRLRELEALQKISTSLQNAEKLDEALHGLLKETLEVLNLSEGFIWLTNNTMGSVYLAVGFNTDTMTPPKELHPDTNLLASVMQTGEIYFSNHNHPAILIPIRSQKNIVGVLEISIQNTKQVNQQEMKMLEAMAEMAGVTIERLKLIEEITQDSRNLATINDVGRSLVESLEPSEIYNHLQKAIYTLIPKTNVIIFSEFDDQQNMINPIYFNRFKNDCDVNGLPSIYIDQSTDNIFNTVIKSKKALILNNITKDDGIIPIFHTHNEEFHSCILSPMLVKDQVIGLMCLHSIEEDYFTQTHADMLSVVGHTAAASLENARLFEQTQSRLEQLQSLHLIDVAITSNPDLKSTLSVLLEQVKIRLGIDAASVLVFNTDEQVLEFAEGIGFRTPALQRTKLSIGEGYAGKAVQHQEIIQIQCLKQESNALTNSEYFNKEDFQVYFGVPLFAKGKLQGVMEIFFRSFFEADEEWLTYLDALAGQAAIAIEGISLFKDLTKANQDLLNAYDATIEGWSRAMDLRDEETEGHTRRVTKLTLDLASFMEINQEELADYRRGALLHDIGKIGVPDQVLRKPGPLDENEWVLMKQHPTFAYQMLLPIEYLHSSLDIPFAHHEKWDGSGYPKGLCGEEIPLPARIFAIVDVYDALTSDRPYRKAWSQERALEYIQDQSEKHFDPKIVEAFLQLMEENCRSEIRCYQTIQK